MYQLPNLQVVGAVDEPEVVRSSAESRDTDMTSSLAIQLVLFPST